MPANDAETPVDHVGLATIAVAVIAVSAILGAVSLDLESGLGIHAISACVAVVVGCAVALWSRINISILHYLLLAVVALATGILAQIPADTLDPAHGDLYSGLGIGLAQRPLGLVDAALGVGVLAVLWRRQSKRR